MNDGAYRKRLAADLPKWRDAGFVTADGATAILASVEGRRPAFGLATIVGTLGALLLGLGVIAFVGANWEYMPRMARFALLVAALAAAYVAAARLGRDNLRIFSEAALLAAGLIFGAAIALVGQTYHLAGEFADAVLLWLVGILGAALLTGSPVMTILGLLGGGYWTWLMTVDNGVAPHWTGLAPVLVGAAIATWLDSHYARIVAVLAFIFWAAVAIVGSGERLDLSFAGAMALAAAAALAMWSLGAALASLTEWPRIAALGQAMLWPTLVAILVALGAEQAATTPSTGEQTLLMVTAALVGIAVLLSFAALQGKALTAVDVAGVVLLGVAAIAFALTVPDDTMWARVAGGVIVLGAALWAINLDQGGHLLSAKTTGLAAFGIEIIYLYVVTLGTILDTAFAFLLGGVLFCVLAWGLYRIDRRLSAREKAVAP